MIRWLLIVFALICPSLIISCYITLNMLLIGRPFPLVRVERLSHPVEVLGWDAEGLFLAEAPGYVPLRGPSLLQAESAILREATKRGVELTDDGRVIALVRIHHWCPNDPVRREIARVDLANVLRFIDSGGIACRGENRRPACRNYAGMFGERGWRTEEFWAYNRWLEDPSLPTW